MSPLSTTSLVLVIFGFVLCSAIPSPNSVGSDIQILLHNDIYGNQSLRNDATIVLGAPQTQAEAVTACHALGEGLWTPPSDLSSADYLKYLGYQDSMHSRSGHGWTGAQWIGGQWHRGQPSSRQTQMFYIHGRINGLCRAITPYGQIRGIDCGVPLPALCTQSAPLSSATSTDTTIRFQTQVTSGNAVYTGYRDKLSFRFLGMRYAAQPERWTYSSVYEASGEVQALKFGDYCTQFARGSEDCLFLNVWTPFLPEKLDVNPRLRSVLFWIYGGAFVNGMGSDPTFDGGNLASRGDVVVVTINYRLNTLGFLALNQSGINGNYGFADQITALQWVRSHIKDFGGDPERVTIFGQSAGAASVRAHLTSPRSAGLFAGAIMQSCPSGTYANYYTIDQEVALSTDPILKLTGCTNSDPTVELACLRSVPASVLATLPTVAMNLVVDGTYIITNMLEFNGIGHTNKVPLMIGTMRDDGAPFITYINTTSLVTSLVDNGLNSSSYIALNSDNFPLPNGPNKTLDAFNVTARVSTDLQFRCVDEATAYAATLRGLFNPLYYYEFNRSYQIPYWSPNPPTCEAPITPGFLYGDPSKEYFKCHSGELQYVFGTFQYVGLPIRDQFDVPFAQFSVDTWSSFARTSDPNPSWAFLAARGFSNTTLELQVAGPWLQMRVDNPTLRQLQWPSLQLPLNERVQCDVLGFPLTYYV